ncbi:hypothetical protein Bbelb_362140 [Branchiostoma belcheri]|nr:hypothetical protein Bbelb_362140 [Branchiostoma belcheri]
MAEIKEVFPGNTDRNTPVTNLLDSPIDARYVRFLPQSWHRHMSMRVEVLGCSVHDAVSEESCDPSTDLSTDAVMAEAMVNLVEGFSKVHHQDVPLTSIHHVLKQLFCWDLPASCPTNGHLSLPNGKRYVAPSDERVDYTTAQARCAAEGGTVALPLDSNEQEYLVFFKNCLDQNAQFWLGVSRPDGTWVDSQGSALGGFSAWAPGEPDNPPHLCSHLVFGAMSDSERRNKWADASCGSTFRYICKTGKLVLARAEGTERKSASRAPKARAM